MAGMRGLAALCALALASGRAFFRDEGDGERAWAQPALEVASGARSGDGCEADQTCCAPARYMGWLPLFRSEPACVSSQLIRSTFLGVTTTADACTNIGFSERTLIHNWVSAGTTGQGCRPGAPVIYQGGDGDSEQAWKLSRASNKGKWPAQGAVPPGGVGLHKMGVHWWPSVGPPCVGEKSYQETIGCLLYDFSSYEPVMYDLEGQVDVHWSGSGTTNELMYDNEGLAIPTTSHQWPFPAFCARAAVSILSTVYNNDYRKMSLLPALGVMFDSFSYSDRKCGSVTKEDYHKALEKTRSSKACWNFCSDFTVVLCYRFRKCRCSEENIAECTDVDNIHCCRSGFLDFLKEERLLKQYTGLVWSEDASTVSRMEDSEVKMRSNWARERMQNHLRDGNFPFLRLAEKFRTQH